METTINTIAEFKKAAKMTHDNSESAAKKWSETWGFAWSWKELWRYKQFTLLKSDKTFQYQVGQVYFRHSHEFRERFIINGEEVTKGAFFKGLNKEQN